jgi:hypothetical protein
MKNKLPKILLTLCILGTLLSLYLYSRFTVDDAFITWRYGKNLVEHGVWDYNKSSIDPTQGYTNPIFAILGIVPPALGWDVVLFFKIISIVIYGLFLKWSLEISKGNWLMVLALFGLPATVIHAFSGLETMLYVFLVSMLLVALHRREFLKSIVLTLILFLTRPEAWSLVVALPLFWLLSYQQSYPGKSAFKLQLRSAIICLAILATFLAIYFFIHIILFGSALPNTFYVKSHGGLRPAALLKFLIFASPILLIVRQRLWPLLACASILFGGMVVSYSTSVLAMNYASRFAFHIFVPAYLFGIYLIHQASSNEQNSNENMLDLVLSKFRSVKLTLLGLLVIFTYYAYDSARRGDWVGKITYYPRYLTAHAEIGKTINKVASKYALKGFSCGDAGMIAYQSDITALDNIGLASTRVARGDIGDKLFEDYELGLLIMHSKNAKNGLPALDLFIQDHLFAWAMKNKFRKIGEIYSLPGVSYLVIYAKTEIPEITDVCKNDNIVNGLSETALIKKIALLPPWKYWHE